LVRHVYLALAGASHAPPTLTGVCGGNPGISCRLVWDLSHSVRAAQITESFLAGPIHLALKLVFVIVLALLIRGVTHLVINRITERAAEALLPHLRSSLPGGGLVRVTLIPVRLVPAGLRRRQRPRTDPGQAAAAEATNADMVPASASAEDGAASDGAGPDDAAHDGLPPGAASLDTESAGITSPDAASPQAAGEHAAPHPHATSHPHVPARHRAVTPQEAAAAAERAMVAERRHQRVRALGSILRSAASVTIFSIAGAVILGDLGINLAPLLASAGVVGIAIGFGAQNLVRDYLTGIFMLLEDQYGVGDVISVGDATGTVETVTLRITRLRDINGIVWHIRNGTIDQVGNQSQGWARAVVDFPVPYTADLATIRTILASMAEAAWTDPQLRGVMLEKPDVWGAQDVSGSEVTMRIVARTAPLRQWEVEREIRARVKAALDAAGIYPDPEPAGAPRGPKSPALERKRPSGL
jgi:hypothetical protein